MTAYDQIAGEYYDDTHKTSRNFDQTTAAAFFENVPNIPKNGLILEVGAGRGRVQEFMGLDPMRVIQLDNSQAMLALESREKCLLRVVHEAEKLPFLNSTFVGVAAFLCDPYLGLEFLSEAFRVLMPEGILVATTPAYEWGVAIREDIKIDFMHTRFLTRSGAKVIVPSILHPSEKLIEKLEFVGFKKENISLKRHRLPTHASPVSKDIEEPARKRGLTPYDVDLLYSIVAKR